MNNNIAGGGRCLTNHSARGGRAPSHGTRRGRYGRPDCRAPVGRRRGVASMIAMLYLVLFSALALGFYATTTMSAQLSRNERAMLEAQNATDSGLRFMRYKLSQLSIPSNTEDKDVPEKIREDLAFLMNKSPNLATKPVTLLGTTVFVPEITLNQNTRFSAAVEWRNSIGRLTVTGLASNGSIPITRTIQVECTLQDRSGDIFGFGLASQGPVAVKRSSGTNIVGLPDGSASILSAHQGIPAIVTGSGRIEGSLSVVESKDQVSLGGGYVGEDGGSNSRPEILEEYVKVIPAPEFPIVDTSVFREYAVNRYVKNPSKHYKNIWIPRNTGASFAGGDVIEGIVYIESPNNVSFSGNATVNGVIVFEGTGGPGVNTLSFQGSVTPNIPNTSEFENIREAAKGLSVLAPTASITMGGSNSGTLQGTMIAHTVSIGGSADVSFKNGSLITLGPAPTKVEGGNLSFTGTGLALVPKVGVTFSGYLRLKPDTYRELH